MPLRLVPWKSGAHRSAALTLLRRLVSVSRTAFSAEPVVSSSFRNYVLHKFRENRRVTSRHILGAAFHEGHYALNLLRSVCAGDVPARRQVCDFVQSLPSGLCRRPNVKSYGRAHEVRASHANPRDPDYSILNRPRLHVTGRRRIPVLVSANGIPMLRIKKPQPEVLSKYIRDKHRRRNGRIEMLQKLEHETLPLAAQEDNWDGLVQKEGALLMEDRGKDQRSISWTTAVRDVKQFIHNELSRDLKKRNEMMKKMQEIVLKERELATQEAEERRKTRRERWLHSKARDVTDLTRL